MFFKIELDFAQNILDAFKDIPRYLTKEVNFSSDPNMQRDADFCLIESIFNLTNAEKESFGEIVAKHGIFAPFIGPVGNSFTFVEGAIFYQSKRTLPEPQHEKIVMFLDGLKKLVRSSFKDCTINPNLILSILYNFYIRKSDDLLTEYISYVDHFLELSDRTLEALDCWHAMMMKKWIISKKFSSRNRVSILRALYEL